MKLKISRKISEELLILLGLVGIVLIFQPFHREAYTIGWVLLLLSTLLYIPFTLIPPDKEKVFKEYLKITAIILIIVTVFVIISISLTPYLVR